MTCAASMSACRSAFVANRATRTHTRVFTHDHACVCGHACVSKSKKRELQAIACMRTRMLQEITHAAGMPCMREQEQEEEAIATRPTAACVSAYMR